MLHQACSQGLHIVKISFQSISGDQEKVEYLVSHGADVNATYNKNNDKHFKYRIDPWVPEVPYNIFESFVSGGIWGSVEKLPSSVSTTRPIHEVSRINARV